MRPLRHSINVTLDGCCDHAAFAATEEVQELLHARSAEDLARADALLLGRVTYRMMEDAFRFPDGVAADPQDPFARTIDAMPKHVVSSTLAQVDWNAELVTGDLGDAVRALKEQPGRGLSCGGVALPRALAELGLVDELQLVVHPTVAGHGPYLFEGLAAPLDLELVDRGDLGAGVTVLRYEPRR